MSNEFKIKNGLIVNGGITGNTISATTSNTLGPILSGGTDLNNIFKPLNAVDVFVTGSTEIDGIIYFDRNDTLSAFTADLTGLITNGNGTTATGTSVNLGGTLTDDVIIDGDNGSYIMALGSYGPNKQLSSFSVGSRNGINLLNYTDNIPNSSLGLFSSGAIFGNMPDGFATVFGKTATLSAYDNRTFIINLYAGIPSGSGESFTINGITFTEGIDFVGQDDKVLDLATIAGLNYSGVTDFISLEHIPGNDYVTFNFTQPAETSQTFSNGYIGSYLYTTEVRCEENGLSLKAGTTQLVINNNNGQTVFTDNVLVPQGIQYGADYSANYTNRSLVDKEYVDGEIAALAATEVFVTGATYSSNTFTFTNNTGGTFDTNFNTVTGLTINGNLIVTGLTNTKGITSTGGINFPQLTINSGYTVTEHDYMIDVTGGTFNVQLPSAVGIQGRILIVKNNGGGAVSVNPYGTESIDDKPFIVLGETNSIQLISNGSIWVVMGYNISTVNSSSGVFEFTGLTKVSSNTFGVGEVKGWIVDDTTNPLSPQLYYVYYSGGVHTDTYVTTANETYVYLTSGGTIGQQSTPLTATQRRLNIFLGKLGHPDRTTINLVFTQPDFVLSPLSQLRDMFTPINLINGGVYPSTNGANLQFNTSAGYIYGLGINFGSDTLNPNSLYIPATNPCTFQYRTQTGGTITNVTSIDPLNYDVGGTITPISGVKTTNQRIYLLQNGTIRVQYGQNTYNNFADAIQALQTEPFTEFPNFINNAVLIGILTVTSSATDLTDTSKAKFFFTSKFGETVGAAGGVSTTTLQQAYNNSTNPEIITNSILNGVQFKGGTGNDNDSNIIIENNSGYITGFWKANGNLSATTISTDYVDFNQNYTGTTTQGRINWDSGTGTLNIGIGDSGTGLIDLQVGQEEVVRVHNSEATTLVKGEVVYVSGSQGNRPSVKRAIATNDGYSVTTLGMVGRDISSGAEGYVTTFGIISNLNTLGLSGGTAIYLSPTIAGGYTSTKPQAPYHIVLIGYVVRVSATVGSIFINISNGWEIDELHDVRITSPNLGDLISYSAYNGSNVWVNGKTLNGSYTITGDTTVGGTLKATTISATTYQNLPIDIYTTGATLSSSTLSFRRNDNVNYTVSLTPIINNLWTAGTGGGSVVLSGSNSVASGLLSVAEGSQTTASGEYAHAEGYQTKALGQWSHAEGWLTTAQYISHAEGYNTSALNVAHAEGYGSSASSFGAHAEGRGCYAGAEGAHAEGSGTIAAGTNSHAEGYGTYVGISFAHAEGLYTYAAGEASHVEGSYNTSLYPQASNSSVGGQRNLASGNTVFIHSSGSTAIGDYSVILGGIGHRINANVTGSTILGGSRITGTTSDTVYGVNFNGSGNIISGGTNLLNIFAPLSSTADTFTTAFTNTNGLFTISRNDGVNISTLFNATTGLTVNGNITITGNTNISGNTNINGTITSGGTNLLTLLSDTGSNSGSGTGIFSGKTGTTLFFKSLTSTANTVTISTTGATINLESNPIENKSFILSSPIAGDRIPIFTVDRAATITKLIYQANSGSTTFNVVTGGNFLTNTTSIFNGTGATANATAVTITAFGGTNTMASGDTLTYVATGSTFTSGLIYLSIFYRHN